MKQSTTAFVLSAAAMLPSVYGQQPAVVGAAMDPVCIDSNGVIIYEQSAYYSTIFNTAGTIFNFLGGTNSLVIENPPQTIITSTILTTTVTTTATTTATVTDGAGTGTVSTTLGAGIPSGTVTAIPSTSPFVLAYLANDVTRKRQADAGNSSLGFVGGNGTSSDPADADRFYLNRGELMTTDGRMIGRNDSDTWVLMTPTPYDNEVTTTFYLVDGIVQWNSSDRGAATFYVCGGALYAGFPNPPPYSKCSDAAVGAVSAKVIDAAAAAPSSSSTTSVVTTSGSGGAIGSSSSSSSSTSSGSDMGSTSSQSSSSTSSVSSSTDGGIVTPPSTTTTSSDGSTPTDGGDGGDDGDNGDGGDGDDGGDSVEGGCPGSPYGSTYFDYTLYCGYVVDPVDATQNLGYPDGQPSTSFDDCTVICDTTDGCTGLSFIEASSTCYVHGGGNKDPVARDGWSGAVLTSTIGGDNGGDDGGDNGGNTGGDGSDSSSTTATTMTTSASGSSSSATSSMTSMTTTAGASGESTTSSSAAASGSSTSSSSSSTVSSTFSGAPGTTTSAAGGADSGSSTTSSAAATTTSAAVATCPTPTGSVVNGYELYCGYAVDPVDDTQKLGYPNGKTNIASFDACVQFCKDTVGCTGLSYARTDTTCYVHGGDNKAPVANAAFDGAALATAASTTTTTAPATSTTTTAADNGGATTTTTASAQTTTTTTAAQTTTTTSADQTTTTGAATTTTTTAAETTTTTTTAAATTTTAAAGGSGSGNTSPQAQDSFFTTTNGCSANSCPTDNDGSIFTDSYSTEYFFFAGGISDQDLTYFDVNTFAECIDKCSTYNDPTTGPCASVSFPLDSFPARCYLHGTCTGIKNGDHFYSARKLPSGCTVPNAAQPREAILAASPAAGGWPGPYTGTS